MRTTRAARSGQAGDLDRYGQFRLGRSGHDPLDRRDVAVVPATADEHMPFTDGGIIGRIVAGPVPQPHLDPGVALAGRGLTDYRLALRVQVARYIASRD